MQNAWHCQKYLQPAGCPDCRLAGSSLPGRYGGLQARTKQQVSPGRSETSPRMESRTNRTCSFFWKSGWRHFSRSMCAKWTHCLLKKNQIRVTFGATSVFIKVCLFIGTQCIFLPLSEEIFHVVATWLEWDLSTDSKLLSLLLNFKNCSQEVITGNRLYFWFHPPRNQTQHPFRVISAWSMLLVGANDIGSIPLRPSMPRVWSWQEHLEQVIGGMRILDHCHVQILRSKDWYRQKMDAMSLILLSTLVTRIYFQCF